jgi:hypothetical protein
VRRILLVALSLTAFLVVSGTASARLNSVQPWTFDPYSTNLVEADWINHIGCPTNTVINTGSGATPYTNAACPTEGRRDVNVQGLLLAKTGPTANIAAAGASLKGVAGDPLTTIGYDIRKHGGFASPLGSSCGAGAPRFNVVTDFGTHFIGCASPPPVSESLGEGWSRLAWSPAQAFPPVPTGAAVRSIDLVFDEGTDTGPTHFGLAILDNVMVNGSSIGLR